MHQEKLKNASSDSDSFYSLKQNIVHVNKQKKRSPGKIIFKKVKIKITTLYPVEKSCSITKNPELKTTVENFIEIPNKDENRPKIDSVHRPIINSSNIPPRAIVQNAKMSSQNSKVSVNITDQNTSSKLCDTASKKTATNSTTNSNKKDQNAKSSKNTITKSNLSSKEKLENNSSRKTRPINKVGKAKQNKTIYCQVCNLRLENEKIFDQHVLGKKHCKNFQRVHYVRPSNPDGKCI